VIRPYGAVSAAITLASFPGLEVLAGHEWPAEKLLVAKSNLIWEQSEVAMLKRAVRRRNYDSPPFSTNRKTPCISQTIQSGGEMKTTTIRIEGIILLSGEASLFANLRVGNTEVYVFFTAEGT
jgi:hypothetical protein